GARRGGGRDGSRRRLRAGEPGRGAGSGGTGGGGAHRRGARSRGTRSRGAAGGGRGGARMTAIAASLVKELRDQTGAGMMDCKRALEETGGDLEAAKRLLRERGMAQAGKRAGRETTEGRVGHRLAAEGSRGTMVAVGCETEPVARNEEFQAFARKVLETVDVQGVGAEQELEDERVELVAKLGENVTVAGAARFASVDGSRIEAYVHPPANKLGTLVNLRGGGPELARKLAMHVSWSAPRWIA